MNSPAQATIELLRTPEEARACATVMAQSEPWLTLKTDFETSLQIVTLPTVETYLARVDGAYAGHVVISMKGPFTGYVQILAVAPEWRGRGIGEQLIRFIERRVFSELPNVFLCVSSFNPRAQKFYARLGYERVGEIKDYIIAGASEFLMRKSIAAKRDFQKSKK